MWIGGLGNWTKERKLFRYDVFRVECCLDGLNSQIVCLRCCFVHRNSLHLEQVLKRRTSTATPSGLTLEEIPGLFFFETNEVVQ